MDSPSFAQYNPSSYADLESQFAAHPDYTMEYTTTTFEGFNGTGTAVDFRVDFDNDGDWDRWGTNSQ